MKRLKRQYARFYKWAHKEHGGYPEYVGPWEAPIDFIWYFKWMAATLGIMVAGAAALALIGTILYLLVFRVPWWGQALAGVIILPAVAVYFLVKPHPKVETWNLLTEGAK